jgi:hypothetical protein
MSLKTAAGTLIRLPGSHRGFIDTTTGLFQDDFSRGGSATVVTPMGLDWVDLSTMSPGNFDPVGLLDGKVVTRALEREKYSGKHYVVNDDPANNRGGEEYLNQPTTIMHGIGGACRETHSVRQRVNVRWCGLVNPALATYDKHSEAGAAVHFVPGDYHGCLGAWASSFDGITGVLLVGFVGNPCERFGVLAATTFAHTVGTERTVWIETTGTGIIAGMDSSQLPLDGTLVTGGAGTGVNHGLNPIDLATFAPWAIGSTKHGFTIDQHVVKYVDGRPSLANVQAAPALTSIEMKPI